ncbi:MAG: S-layer homology domain-containing protein [Clostridia bacterium]|nr:S-layer homology domain-containing protein [Clostridia bacterium]
MKKIIIALIIVFSAFLETANAAEMSEWAKGDYSSASEKGLIPLSIAVSNLTDNVTRGEFCNLAMNMFDTLYTGEVKLFDCPFTDCNNDYIVKAYSLGIVHGKTETEFCPFDSITRQEMAKILVNTLETAGKKLTVSSGKDEKAYSYADFSDVASWAVLDFVKVIKYGIMSGVSETELNPNANATREQAVAIANRSVDKFKPNAAVYAKPKLTNMENGAEVSNNLSVTWDKNNSAEEYIIIVKDEDCNLIDICTSVINQAGISTENFDKGKRYTITVAEVSDKTVFSDAVEVIYDEEEERFQINTVSDKYRRVFQNGTPFKTKDEADANMATVQIPVWHLKDNGTKVASKTELVVNANLAADVVKIFTEIFEDAEQFPIKNVGGYSWRNTAMGKVSEHSYGTCIDINYDENYYCYADTGQAITGSFWKPFENPYSITPDGSVVRTFAKYGWAWGGNAWSRLHDYMHFTYLGN